MKAKSIQSKTHINTWALTKQLIAYIKLIAWIIIFVCIVFASQKANAEIIKAGVMQSTPITIVSEWYIGEDTQVGEHFSARVVEHLLDPQGRVLIPKNSRVVGTVTNINKAKSFRRRGKVDILFEKIVLPDNVQSLNIDADGALIMDPKHPIKASKELLKQTATGAAMGAIGGLKFAGITGAYSSFGNSLTIGAATGASLALISFAAQKGKEVEIYPGLPMNLNLVALEQKEYKEQAIKDLPTGVSVDILSFNNDSVTFELDNQLDRALSLNNLKITDGLGYSFNPTNPGKKKIPAFSTTKLTIKFPPVIVRTKQWLVLTDSFNKREYFREAIN